MLLHLWLACVTYDCLVKFLNCACDSRMNLGDGAYLKALIDQPLLVQGAEDPPHTFHEAGVQSLVVILKVNPPANALDCLLPFFGIPAATDVLRPVKVLLERLTVSSANPSSSTAAHS